MRDQAGWVGGRTEGNSNRRDVLIGRDYVEETGGIVCARVVKVMM